jgi:hypothetical protein
MAFFIVTAMKTSNLPIKYYFTEFAIVLAVSFEIRAGLGDFKTVPFLI